METLKLRANLFRRGNEIISYNTVVAHIEGKQLIEHGKYSRTTGKHVAYVAQLFNLRIVQSNVRKRDTFYKYDQGEANIKIPGALSERLSKEIAKEMADGSTFREALASIEKIGTKDLDIVKDHLGISDKELAILRKVNRITRIA